VASGGAGAAANNAGGRVSRLWHDAQARARIMGELHAIVPMVTLDAAISGKTEVAKRNVEFSTSLRDMFSEMADGKKAMLANLQREIAECEAQVVAMGDAVKVDQDKLARLEAGEDVPVKELDCAAMVAILKSAGLTDADIRHMRRVACLSEAGFDQYSDERIRAMHRHDERSGRTIARRILRREQSA
jgi:hypothetical protein